MKSIIKITSTLYFILYNSYFITAQTVFTIENQQFNHSEGYVVFHNTKLVNNSTFNTGTGEVIMEGDASDANTTIEGTTITAFYNLNINKSNNNVLLGNSVYISNTLILNSGLLDISDYNLEIGSSGTISNANENRYVKTSGTGTLNRIVTTSYVDFPVGVSGYKPLAVQNTGISDTFQIRVEEAVYQDGNSGTAITSDAVNASWHISEAVDGGSNASFFLQWYDTDELTGFDRTHCNVAIYTNNAWITSADAAAFGTNPYLKSHNGISQLGTFIINSNTAQLPVELLYFYGEKVDAGVQLHWETATEINNSHFDVEWSRDGISFEKIGEVAGAGTTNEVQFYEFVDDLNRVGFQNRRGLHYYRLKQVDFDGKYEYTDIITIEFEQSNNITFDIYPNPAAHYLKIESKDLINEIVQIFNVNGQLVKEFQHQSLITNLPITNLPSGTYFIKVGQQVKKLIVEK